MYFNKKYNSSNYNYLSLNIIIYELNKMYLIFTLIQIFK